MICIASEKQMIRVLAGGVVGESVKGTLEML